MASWEDDLQLYERSKRGAPVLRQSSPPARRVRTQKKMREPIDLVLQKYRDKDVEEFQKIRERRETIDAINKGKDLEIEREGVVDNINHRSKYLGNSTMVPLPFMKPGRRTYSTKRSGVNYDIIQNKPLVDGKKEENTVDPSFSMANRLESRDFDIISNSYLVDDERKKLIDKEVMRTEAMKKYWETNVFDVIRCNFNDPEMEEKFQVERDASKHHHGERHLRGLPPCVRESEGQLFNIVNMQPRHNDLLNEYDKKKALSANGHKIGYEFEQQNRLRAFDDQEKEQLRSLRRISHERYAQEISRGYRIVSNVPYEGSHGVPAAPAKTFRRDTLGSIFKANSKRRAAGKHQSVSAEPCASAVEAHTLQLRCTGERRRGSPCSARLGVPDSPIGKESVSADSNRTSASLPSKTPVVACGSGRSTIEGSFKSIRSSGFAKA